MKKILFGLVLLGCFSAVQALAQQPVMPCVNVTQNVNGINVTSCMPVSASNPLPVAGGSGGPTAVSPSVRGTAIVAGGTSQLAVPTNSARKLVVIENPCTAASEGIATAEDLFVQLNLVANINSANNFADLAPCGSTSIVVSGLVFTGSVSVNAATTGHLFIITEFQ